MKTMVKNSADLVVRLGMGFAVIFANMACFSRGHQPKVPNEVNSLRKF